MNKLELLRSQIKTLEILISKETEEKDLKSYIEQRDNLLIEVGAENARIAAEEKAMKEAAEEKTRADKGLLIDAANKSPFTGQPKIIVGDPDNYKGFNLKRVIGDIRDIDGVNEAVKSRIISRPEKAFGLLKMFTDMYEKAYANSPAEAARIKAAMQEGTPAEGGYLTPIEQRAELFSYVREMSVVMPDVTHIPMTSDSMTIPAELTKVTTAWTSEETDATESEPTFAQVTLTASRLDAFSTSSNELLEDTNVPGGIVAVLLSQFTEAVAKEIDKQVLVGTGSPVSGIFTAQAGYSEVFSSGSTAFSELLESNIRNIIGIIPPERLDGAKWYMHNTVLWTYMYGLKDTQGRPLFVPSLAQSVPGTLYGYPAKQSSQATSTSASGATMAAFGNLKGFVIGDRLTNIRLFADPYTLGKSYQTNFYFFTRWALAHALNGYYGRIVTA